MCCYVYARKFLLLNWQTLLPSGKTSYKNSYISLLVSLLVYNRRTIFLPCCGTAKISSRNRLSKKLLLASRRVVNKLKYYLTSTLLCYHHRRWYENDAPCNNKNKRFFSSTESRREIFGTLQVTRHLNTFVLLHVVCARIMRPSVYAFMSITRNRNFYVQNKILKFY